MSQFDAWYPPHITGPVAIQLHTEKYGDPWPHYAYVARPWPAWPLDPVFMHVTMDFMADVYRMVVNYELGSPPLNSAVTTHDWAWISEDPIASSSYETVEAKFDDFWDAIGGWIPAEVKLVGYRWSKWKDDFSKPDPSFRFAVRDDAGTVGDGGCGAPQVACAITEETAIRRRWGRFYLPFIHRMNVVNGRFPDAFCTSVGAAAVEMLETVEDEWQHVTVSTEKDPHILPTNFVRVDNVPDVIRSRRWDASTFRYRAAVS